MSSTPNSSSSPQNTSSTSSDSDSSAAPNENSAAADLESTQPGEANSAIPASGRREEYTVVARRYRPLTFAQLVGQDGLARALQNAIETDRVGHAYLFTGARGVGKTSTARIFSKALNCAKGATTEPCNQCDICEGIASGTDVDVLEIDGASNRGIDEIRQLRSNVSVRPSRARLKIYIIDEVHMLTSAAFNALLKTLEEPPAHVKFIFCTTDPEKLPITVLSRCQRFDFAPVGQVAISERLSEILAKEGVEADPAAIRLIARRAAGSVRDSQSLLEQVLSFHSGSISIEDVHTILGTIQSSRLVDWLEEIQKRDAAATLKALDHAIMSGIDAGQLADQLLGIIRDALALSVNASNDLLLHTESDDAARLLAIAQGIGTPTLLAMAQIVDQTLVRLRQAMDPRIHLEIAVVRLCSIANLDDISQTIERIGNLQHSNSESQVSNPPSTNSNTQSTTNRMSTDSSVNAPSSRPIQDSARNDEPSGDSSSDGEPASPSSSPRKSSDNSPPKTSPPVNMPANESHGTNEQGTQDDSGKKNDRNLRIDSVEQNTEGDLSDPSPTVATKWWTEALEAIGDTTELLGKEYDSLAILAPNHLVVSLKSSYNKEMCERPERKSRIESALAQVSGRRIRLSFQVTPGKETSSTEVGTQKRTSTQQRMRAAERHPLVKRLSELFDTQVEDVQLARKQNGQDK